MAHEAQKRYAKLVDAKLRQVLVTQDKYIFNTRYEGTPTAGMVKVPVRDTEVKVRPYNKAKGLDPEMGTTTYYDLPIDKDEAVNELIDGYDAAAVPDGIVADRLESAGYSLGQSIDAVSIAALENADGAKIEKAATATTQDKAYKAVLDAKTYLSRTGVPQTERWLLASPEFIATLMMDDHYIRQGDLSQELKNAGAVGSVAGFAVFECAGLAVENTEITDSKKTTTEFVAGHPAWCHRVMEWQVPVKLQDLAGSGNYIGTSAVQGRKVYGVGVSKPQTLYIKRVEKA